jgi:hypothetical protein
LGVIAPDINLPDVDGVNALLGSTFASTAGQEFYFDNIGNVFTGINIKRYHVWNGQGRHCFGGRNC